MYTKIYWINDSGAGARIGIMPRPRGGEWLRGEIDRLKDQKEDVLVSLLEREEVRELGLSKGGALCAALGIEFINCPIPERGVPTNGQAVGALVKRLRAMADEGRTMVIHCRMGIGRSSIIAGTLFKGRLTATQVLQQISSVRGLSVPIPMNRWAGSIGEDLSKTTFV